MDIKIKKLTPGLAEAYPHLFDVTPHDDHAAKDGFDFVEAYASRLSTDHDCRGHFRMYEKCGFSITGEKDGRVTVRRALRQ